MHHDLIAAVDAQFAENRADLERLIRIPSVSAPGFDAAAVRRSAEATADVLRSAGFDAVELLEVEGSHPAVLAEIAAPPGAPTVLLYAHHDVQPPGSGDEWTSPPFDPADRDGRLYGRGSADDKAGIVVHAGAVRAHAGRPPVGVKVFVEGEEETGSEHLGEYLARFGARLAADVIVIADSENWRVGTPAFTTSLRGLAACIVEVRTLRHGVHSGGFGGVFPDALTVLSRILATLHDADGRVAIPGLVSEDADPLDLSEAELREQAGAIDGIATIGSGTLTGRMWRQPAVSVLAIDAPRIDQAINQLVPVARAKVSMRLAPGEDVAAAQQALVDHLHRAAAWGAEVTVTPELPPGEPIDLAPTGAGYEAFRRGFEIAYGREPVEIGVGGSIPFVADFADRFPDASIVLIGAGDPTSAAHGPDESVDLGDLRRSILAEAIAFAELAALT